MINRVQYTTFKKLYSLLSITDKKKKEKWIFYFTRKTRLPKWPCSRPNQRRTNKISALYDSQLQTSHRAPNWHRRTCPENWIFHTRVPEKRTLPRRAEGGTRGWTVINLSCVRGPGLEDKTGEFCLNVSKTRSGSDKTEKERGEKFGRRLFETGWKSACSTFCTAKTSRVFETCAKDFEGKNIGASFRIVETCSRFNRTPLFPPRSPIVLGETRLYYM